MPLYSRSSTPNFQAFAPLQPSQWRQRIVHTHTFRIYEYGNAPADLLVEEVDSSGHSRGRSLGYFFNGIVGRARDRHGNQVDSWHQATQLANYWRRHFGVPEDSRSYHDHNPDDGAEPRMWRQPNPPVAITQLAWLLHNILSQDPAGNESILSTLSTGSPVSSDLPPEFWIFEPWWPRPPGSTPGNLGERSCSTSRSVFRNYGHVTLTTAQSSDLSLTCLRSWQLTPRNPRTSKNLAEGRGCTPRHRNPNNGSPKNSWFHWADLDKILRSQLHLATAPALCSISRSALHQGKIC